MKKLLLGLLGILIYSLGFSQITGYSYTMVLGPANNQLSIYAIPNGTGTVKWGQIDVCVGFKSGSPQPGQGTFVPNASLFGAWQGVSASSSTSTDGQYKYTDWGTNLASGSITVPLTAGTPYLMGVITYPASPVGAFVPYLLDFANSGNDGFANTYIVDGATGTYFYPTDGTGTSSFVAGSGGIVVDKNNATDWSLTTTVPLLPLKLLSFIAAPQTGKTNTVLLSWTVAEQVNTSSFIVERSTDGVNYTAIGTVAAAGNYAGKQTYSYTDAAAQNGTNYYRLKMVDIDGQFTYSPVKPVNFDGAAANVYVVPNVTRGQFYVKGLSNKAMVQVTDMAGKLVKKYNNVDQYTILDISSFASGVYVVEVIQDEKYVGTYKVIKQ